MLQNDLTRPCCCHHGDLTGHMPSKRLDTFQEQWLPFHEKSLFYIFFLFLTFIFPVWAITWKLKSSLIYTGESWSSSIDCSVYTCPTRISGAHLSLLPAGFGWTRPSGFLEMDFFNALQIPDISHVFLVWLCHRFLRITLPLVAAPLEAGYWRIKDLKSTNKLVILHEPLAKL